MGCGYASGAVGGGAKTTASSEAMGWRRGGAQRWKLKGEGAGEDPDSKFWRRTPGNKQIRRNRNQRRLSL